MSEQDKQLLLVELCARLPYGVKCEAIDKNARFFIAGKYEYIEEVVKNIGTLNSKESIVDGDLFGLRNIQHSTQNKYYVSPVLWRIEDIKPYLRSMSSMTEEEKKEFISEASYDIEESINGRHYEYYLKDGCVGSPDSPTANYDAIDWLNSHHFDYRGLIEKGLAIEAPEGMYNF